MRSINIVIALLIIFIISCARTKVIIQPEQINNDNYPKDKNASYYLITTDNDKIDFNEFEVHSDTLTIIPTNKYSESSKSLKIPFNKIKKIYTYHHPNKTRNSILFLSSIFLGYLILMIIALRSSGPIVD